MSAAPTPKVFALEPAQSAVLFGDEPGPHGLQGVGSGVEIAVLDPDLMDGVIQVSEREAIAAARRHARTEGLPSGIPSDAALHAGLNLSRYVANVGKLIVAIAPSFAECSLSNKLFQGL